MEGFPSSAQVRNDGRDQSAQSQSFCLTWFANHKPRDVVTRPQKVWYINKIVRTNSNWAEENYQLLLRIMLGLEVIFVDVVWSEMADVWIISSDWLTTERQTCDPCLLSPPTHIVMSPPPPPVSRPMFADSSRCRVTAGLYTWKIPETLRSTPSTSYLVFPFKNPWISIKRLKLAKYCN